MGTFHIKKASNGWQYYWTLEAANGEVIATSEMYNSKAAAQGGAQAVKNVAATAPVLDMTLPASALKGLRTW